MGNEKMIVDMHMHSTESDGTDTPEELLEKVRAEGISLFSLTDHDAVEGCRHIRPLLRKGDPEFVNGVEFSCRDAKGKYHILGYGYDIDAKPINELVEYARELRIYKLEVRLEFLESEFGFTFADEDLDILKGLYNPGKPHIANLMVRYGYAPDRNTAIREYIDKKKIKDVYILPGDAIEAIVASNGRPVLAHPTKGSGDQDIHGDEMDERLRHLLNLGLEGAECFYSSFSEAETQEMLQFAKKYHLYVSAGSDYHGNNKTVKLADTGLYQSYLNRKG